MTTSDPSTTSTTGEPTGLRLGDLQLDAASGVRVLPDGDTTTSYRDGAEQYLLEVLGGSSDRSVGSPELARHVRDWASLYHLTPYRSTILDCLGLERLAGTRVLELGAGCGPVTRWLGERRAEVHAVEGSVSRAGVARRRCEDLPDVDVYAANFSALDERGGFDMVTLVGVLEYSHLYHPLHRDDPAAAAAANLEMAARALGDEGVLVLAIENRLGLRYLNGGREDHSGRTFEGVQGYPWPGTPVTYSRREMEQLLAGAGFGHVETLLPYPDYKLARAVINPARCTDEDRIHNWVADVAPDRGVQRRPTLFNESLAVREFARAGLLSDVSNSHLFLAFRGDPRRTCTRLGIDLSWSARSYSLNRRPGLRKRITLVDGVVECDDRPLGERADEGLAARTAMRRFGVGFEPRAERRARGDLLVLEVLADLTTGGLGGGFAEHVRRHRQWLIATFGTGDPRAAVPMVDGSAFDATWWNIVVEPATGDWQFIDREWRLETPVPADYVVWRTLTHFFARNTVQLPEALRGRPPASLVSATLEAAGVSVSEAMIAAFERTEDALLVAIEPGPVPTGPCAELEALGRVADAPRAFAVVAFAAEVADAPRLLSGYAECFGPEDAATLVLYAPDGDEAAVGDRVEAAMASAGLAEAAPDIMLLAIPGGEAAERAILDQACALLSEREVIGTLSILPRVGMDDVGQLRPYAEAVWAAT